MFIFSLNSFDDHFSKTVLLPLQVKIFKSYQFTTSWSLRMEALVTVKVLELEGFRVSYSDSDGNQLRVRVSIRRNCREMEGDSDGEGDNGNGDGDGSRGKEWSAWLR